MRYFGWLVCLPLFLYGVLCVYLFIAQRSILYYPTKETDYPGAEPLFLKNGEHRLKIWNVSTGSDKALLYFGGNAEDAAMALAPLKILFPGYTLYVMNYRGYGGSSGRPSERALCSDAVMLYDAIRARHGEILVYGRSLGTGVAIHLASKRPVSGMILTTPYDSMVNVARHYYPYLPVQWLMKDRYDSVALADAIDIPVLVLIAERDEVIPRENSDKLVSALVRGKTEVNVITGFGHNDLERSPLYRQAIARFLGDDHAQDRN